MPYRICTIDSTGTITSISPESYETNSFVLADIVAQNPKAFSFIDEDLIKPIIENVSPGTIAGRDNEFVSFIDANGVSVISGGDFRGMYDPRTEVTLFIDNENLVFNHGDRVIQDVTKVTTFYNTADTVSLPYHSTAIQKFGSASGKFTKSGSGYSGGGIYVTNVSKTDYAGYTAPHNNVAVTGAPSYSLELFFYPTTIGSNFTLMQKGAAGASANWKLGYDSSAGFLQFAWQSYGRTAGYNYSKNIIDSSGLTLNTWHHVAVSVVRNVTSGVGYLISGYFNGRNTFTESVTAASFPETRYGNGVYIGCDFGGNEQFDGYIDSVRMLESGSTYGIFGKTGYGFLPHGSGTLAVPVYTGFTRNSETAFTINFNGVNGSSNFYAESKDYIAGIVTKITNLELGPNGVIDADVAEVGTRDVVRYTVGYTAGITAYSDPTGFTTNYGHIVNPFVAASGNTTNHGFDYIYPLIRLRDENPSLDVYRRNYRYDTLYDTNKTLLLMMEGAYGNRGSCGSPYQTQYGTNPFSRLFNGATGGCGNCYGIALAHNSLYINPMDRDVMKYIMDNGYLVSQGIASASYSFVDGRGIVRNLTALDILNLRLDILNYQNNLINALNTTIAAINAAPTKDAVKNAKNNKGQYMTLTPGDEFDIFTPAKA